MSLRIIDIVLSFNYIIGRIAAIRNYTFRFIVKKQLASCGKNVIFIPNRWVNKNYSKIHLSDNTSIYSGFNFISYTGHFYMGAHSGAAEGLLVITGNHHRTVSALYLENALARKGDVEKDVIVEEDVWLGARVTLLSGVVVGRGATVGAGTVCSKNIPPYAIVVGNPAKIVGFNFTPAEILEHEKALYPEEERLPLDLLEKNYDKYFLKRIKEIKEFTKI